MDDVAILEGIPGELLHALLDNPHESQILVDDRGIVRYISSANEEFYKTSREKAIGRPVKELNPESELLRVLETGRAEIGRIFRINNRESIIARIPLRNRNGKIVGAVGKLMFWDPEKIKDLTLQVEVLEKRLDYYEKELQEFYRRDYSLDRVAGESRLIQEARKTARQAAASDLPVLILGETGTGKDVFAHAVHQLSARRKHPLIRVNCAAIPHELFESELFGYEAGAFTGANPRGKPGKFELADKGTIFLDEIGDLPPALQVKLLRVIQDREVERLGGTKPRKVDFRIIAATNRDIRAMLAQGLFRADLYYRMNIFTIHTPPLRQIPEDIPRLAYHLLATMGREKKRGPDRITPEAMQLFLAYDWPGNVRELRNALERAAAVADDGPIMPRHLPPEIRDLGEPGTGADKPVGTLKEEMARAERRIVERALRQCGGSRTRAAQMLNIHRTGLHQKIKRYGLE